MSRLSPSGEARVLRASPSPLAGSGEYRPGYWEGYELTYEHNDYLVLIETFPPEARRHTERQVEESGDGWRFPMPPMEELANMASLEGVDDDHLKLLRSRAVAQPFGTYTQPLWLENPAREELPKLGILCSFSLDRVQEMIASGNPLFRGLAGPEWRFVELPTGHWPMFSRPEDFAELLLKLPSNSPGQ